MPPIKKKPRHVVAFDTETTGVDLYHSCRPFYFSFASDREGVGFYEWEVDPLTRMPNIPEEDKEEIRGILEGAEELVAQNAKFDITALASIGIEYRDYWFKKTRDTTYSGHLLNTSGRHNLTDMALEYLRVDIQPYEDAVVKACNEARTMVRTNREEAFTGWRIAKEGDPGLPSLGERPAKWDMWLPRTVARHLGYPEEHPWWTVTQEYANPDAAVTLGLWNLHRELIEEKGLWKVYAEGQKLIRVIYEMERKGVTYSQTRLDDISSRFRKEAEEDEQVCIALAQGKLEKLPKAGTSKAMSNLFFVEWNLPVVSLTEKGSPSVNKGALAAYRSTLSQSSRQGMFVRRLINNRKRNTAVSYMEAYTRFGLPLYQNGKRQLGVRVLHPNLNATGSHTLRMSSSNPNEQNIGKEKDEEGFSIRYCFGPATGREWWSLDFENLELMIPAYAAEEQAMIELFEKPHEAPFYGSQHLLVSSILWPKEFEACLRAGESFKDKYKATLYQWTKNGNFAVTYGAMEESGTADAAYHQEGAQAKIKSRFKNLEALNQSCIRHAQQHGFVWTMVDKGIGSGYPIQVGSGWFGKVKPTQPLNYHVQGTAMWCMRKAMVRASDYLKTLPGSPFITMQIHDEMVFDFPKGRTARENYNKVLEVKRLMELSGKDIGVPLRVSVSYHPSNWSEEVKV